MHRHGCYPSYALSFISELAMRSSCLSMLRIRSATVHEAALLWIMIRETGGVRAPTRPMTIREEDLARDGFGENPRFGALIAEWEGPPAGYAFFFGYYSTWAGRGLFLEICSCERCFAAAASGLRCWPR